MFLGIAATVKVTSEGSHGNFQHNFVQDGMFVVNGQKITVNHGRGMNILTYDIFARTHNFQVLIFFIFPRVPLLGLILST